ncbi:MAG: biopolymer transporter ExbD [Cyanobacteria bacterium J06650_10]
MRGDILRRMLFAAAMRLSEDSEINRSGVNILPMIDVIFAILAFFILSTLYLTRAEGLPVELPQAVTSTPQNQVDVTLTITPAGDLFIGEAAITLDSLATEVNRLAAERPILVTIRADESTSHGTVVAAMDQLRTVDNIRLGIATIQP